MAVARHLILISGFALMLAGAGATTSAQAPPDLEAFARKVREVIRAEYAEPVRFNYTEEGRDVDVSMFGKVSVGPLETYEVRQEPPGEAWRRLVARDGKPLDRRRARAPRRRPSANKIERLRAETPAAAGSAGEERSRGAARARRDPRRRRARVCVQLCRPRHHRRPSRRRRRPEAAAERARDNRRRPADEAVRWQGVGLRRPTTTSHASRLHAIDSVSVGWGVVARVERGSGFDFAAEEVRRELGRLAADDRRIGQHAALPLVSYQDRHHLHQSRALQAVTSRRPAELRL